jgi:hypothetical protein
MEAPTSAVVAPGWREVGDAKGSRPMMSVFGAEALGWAGNVGAPGPRPGGIGGPRWGPRAWWRHRGHHILGGGDVAVPVAWWRSSSVERIGHRQVLCVGSGDSRSKRHSTKRAGTGTLGVLSPLTSVNPGTSR